MKYVIFAAFCLLSMPLMIWASYSSVRLRGWLLGALVFSTCLGTRSSIHLISYEGYRGTEDGLIVYLTDVICASLIIGMIARHPARLRWLPPNSGWLALLFGVACVSAAQAPHPLYAGFALFTFVKAYAIFWCAYNCLSLGTSPMSLWWAFASIGGLVTLLTAKQHFINHEMRVDALFPHSNTLPSYCFLFLPVLLLWSLCGPGLRSWQRQLGVLVCLGMSFGIVETLSRAGIVLLGMMLFAVVGLAWRRSPSARTRRACGIMLACMLAGGLVLSARVVRRFENAPKASLQAREEFNRAALEMSSDYPMGVGPNNYSYVLSTFERYRRQLVVLRYETEAGVCHNIFLLTAAELGWAGLAVFLVVVGRFLWTPFAVGRGSRHFEGLVLYGIAMGFASVLLNGMLEWVMRQPFVMDMYAAMAGFSLAVIAAARERRLADAARAPLVSRPSLATPRRRAAGGPRPVPAARR